MYSTEIEEFLREVLNMARNAPGHNKRQCSECKDHFLKQMYSKKQWRKSVNQGRKCKQCTESQRKTQSPGNSNAGSAHEDDDDDEEEDVDEDEDGKF